MDETSASTTTDEVFADLWHRRHLLLVKLAVSYAYHRKRQRFFDLVDKGTKAATVLVGASLLGQHVQQHLPLAAALVSGLSLLSLVYSYSDRKQTHKEIAEAFIHLQAQVEEQGQTTFTVEGLARWEAAASRLDAREPPALRTLVTICQNEAALAAGHPAAVCRLPWYRRTLAHWVS